MHTRGRMKGRRFNHASSTHRRSFRDGLDDGEVADQNLSEENKGIIDAPVVLVC